MRHENAGRRTRGRLQASVLSLLAYGADLCSLFWIRLIQGILCTGYFCTRAHAERIVVARVSAAQRTAVRHVCDVQMFPLVVARVSRASRVSAGREFLS